MSERDFDFFVIGGGSGGVRAARVAARYGARVALAEAGRMGGTCVNVGCVPKKLLVYASRFADDFADAEGFGWTLGETRFDWATLIANKDREIARLNGVYRSLLEKAGVTILDGRARFIDGHTLDVAGRRVTAKHVLIATGSRASVPELHGREHVIVSDDAFALPRLPERIVIVGGGYIAVEFAGIFHGLGAHTTQLHRSSLPLRGFDDDVRRHLADAMRDRGIDLRLGAHVERIEAVDGASPRRVTLTGGETIEADVVMYATGRTPNTEGLGLEAIGVETTFRGGVKVDEYSRTTVDHVYAVGDVTDRVMLTPVAIAEGAAVARTIFAAEPTTVSHHDIATAVFSNPPVATVGCTEAHARSQHNEVDVYRTTFRPMRNTLAGRDERTLMKLIVDRATDRVLGVHVVGPDAAEIVQGFAVAVKIGATKRQIDATIGIHPTAAEELVTMREPITPKATPPPSA